MKRFIKSEKGYSLLLTTAVVVLFTILGLSLLTLTSSGVIKNKQRESQIQAQDLADKGITYAVNDIQKYLENGLNGKTNGIKGDEFQKLIENSIDKNTKIKCPSSMVIPSSDNSNTKVCIEEVRKISEEEHDKYKRVVTFKSTGVANGKEHVTRAEVILGTDAVPDQLRYAVSSNEGGNLYFHGGVEVQGDIKSSGDIYINKNAHRQNLLNITKWERSVPLKLLPNKGSSNASIILTNKEKKLYYFEKDSGNFQNYNPKDAIRIINPQNSNSSSKLSEILTDSTNVSLITKELAPDSIDVEAKVQEVYDTSSYDERYPFILSTSPPHKRDDVILVSLLKCIEVGFFHCKKTDLARGGSMTLTTSQVLKGTYYVNGDLTIFLSNLNNDAIFYVNGEVNITLSTLTGTSPESTLIIFASKDIRINNSSQYPSQSNIDTQNSLKGFFYTEEDLIIDGMYSKLNLIGGLSAKNIFLSTIRGKPSLSGGIFNWIGTETDSNQKTSSSRLKVTYDENLIQQYTSFKRDNEVVYITNINKPEILKRY